MKPYTKALFFMLLFALTGNTFAQEVSPSWQAFVTGQPHEGVPVLPDYSYAGYALCPETIEEAQGQVFHLRDFGGIPDDELSDRQALIDAITAAEANGGGIIQFEAGVYRLNEVTGRDESIMIHADHIVLRGVRETAPDSPRTVLYMKHHLEPRNPEQMWSTQPLIVFALNGERRRAPRLTMLAADSQRGSFQITVEDASRLEVGAFINLRMQNPDANPSLLAGLEPWEIWSNTNEQGIRMQGEKHRITAIDGQTITLAEPILTDIHAAHGWQVLHCPLAHGWCVEDITFQGDCPEPFVHHQSAMMDSGWTLLGIRQGYGPVVRRCRFVDVTAAVNFGGCYGATAIHNTLEGRQGHTSIASNGFSYGTLIAFCQDLIEEGSFHGFGTSAGAAGTVIYRCKNSNRGFDWHASGPYATLIDACSGGLIGNGGNYTRLPNHLQDLTFWNFNQTSGRVYEQLNWWSARRGTENYRGPHIVLPRIIGHHGLPTTYLPEHCLLIESQGQPVHPQSLFEAQLEHRLGALPDWILEGRERMAR